MLQILGAIPGILGAAGGALGSVGKAVGSGALGAAKSLGSSLIPALGGGLQGAMFLRKMLSNQVTDLAEFFKFHVSSASYVDKSTISPSVSLHQEVGE